jgi:hypothetical protein
VPNDPEPFQTQVVRQLGDIARPVRETPAWLIGAVTVSRAINCYEPNSTRRGGGVMNGEVRPSPWRAVQGNDGGSTGISDLDPCEVAAVSERDHPRLGTGSHPVLAHWAIVPSVASRASSPIGSPLSGPRCLDGPSDLSEVETESLCFRFKPVGTIRCMTLLGESEEEHPSERLWMTSHTVDPQNGTLTEINSSRWSESAGP